MSIDYVKIDVEGHELAVLNGFGDLISKVKLVQFEIGAPQIAAKTYFKDFWYFFAERGFLLFRIAPSGLIQIANYSGWDECFTLANCIAVNKAFKDDNF